MRSRCLLRGLSQLALGLSRLAQLLLPELDVVASLDQLAVLRRLLGSGLLVRPRQLFLASLLDDQLVAVDGIAGLQRLLRSALQRLINLGLGLGRIARSHARLAQRRADLTQLALLLLQLLTEVLRALGQLVLLGLLRIERLHGLAPRRRGFAQLRLLLVFGVAQRGDVLLELVQRRGILVGALLHVGQTDLQLALRGDLLTKLVLRGLQFTLQLVLGLGEARNLVRLTGQRRTEILGGFRCLLKLLAGLCDFGLDLGQGVDCGLLLPELVDLIRELAEVLARTLTFLAESVDLLAQGLDALCAFGYDADLEFDIALTGIGSCH